MCGIGIISSPLRPTKRLRWQKQQPRSGVRHGCTETINCTRRSQIKNSEAQSHALALIVQSSCGPCQTTLTLAFDDGAGSKEGGLGEGSGWRREGEREGGTHRHGVGEERGREGKCGLKFSFFLLIERVDGFHQAEARILHFGDIVVLLLGRLRVLLVQTLDEILEVRLKLLDGLS